jgi:S1-C subfamily serine protease
MGVGLIAALLVAVIVVRSSSGPAALSRSTVDSIAAAAVDKGISDAKTAPPDSVQVYQTILPSLVVIRTERAGNDGNDDSLGTGVVVNTAGAILTARHVIAGASAIHVTFGDGTNATATVASEDPANDIAVLMTDQSSATIVPAVLGSTGGLHVGDDAFAVGHPLGLTDSFSAGVISGLNRSVPLGDGSTIKGLIQFDAAVNPGNSGGPLLNRDGQVIGIVTALANPSQQGFFIGIGFAVPIGTASGAAGGPDL